MLYTRRRSKKQAEKTTRKKMLYTNADEIVNVKRSKAKCVQQGMFRQGKRYTTSECDAFGVYV